MRPVGAPYSRALGVRAGTVVDFLRRVPVLLVILKLLVGLTLLTIGADWLVRGAASLAIRLGVSSLVVGLTIVACGTSAPELLVCVRAALDGRTDLAVGNAVGSNVFNTAAILGAAALIYPIQCSVAVIKREVPLMILVGALLVAAALVGAPAHVIGRGEGVALLVVFVGYIWLTYALARREGSSEFDEEFRAERAGTAFTPRILLRDIGFVVLGIAGLVIGARLLVDAAVHIAVLMGVSELVIGLTIVGAGTGLPELATSIAAAFRKHSDIAVGNVLGSNIFNILLILGATSTITPLPVESEVLRRDLPVMMFLFVIAFPIMLTRRRIGRLEGALLLSIYVMYLVTVYRAGAVPLDGGVVVTAGLPGVGG